MVVAEVEYVYAEFRQIGCTDESAGVVVEEAEGSVECVEDGFQIRHCCAFEVIGAEKAYDIVEDEDESLPQDDE